MLSRLFRRLFLKYLERAFDAGKLQFFSALQTLRTRRVFLRHLAPARTAKWTVYAKPPFGAPDQALNDPEPVLKSMARYTHRPAISDDRLLSIEDDQATARRTDHRDDSGHDTIAPSAGRLGASDRALDDEDPLLKYMARHTHSIAISNDRLLDIEHDKVAFRWKDYRDNNREKIMVLPAEEFIRRFLLHVLPDGFQRIRYYGFLANRYRKQKLALCRQLLQMPSYDPHEARSEIAKNYRDHYEDLTGCSLLTCPVCHQGHMLVIEVFGGTKRSRRAARPAKFADHPSINDNLMIIADTLPSSSDARAAPPATRPLVPRRCMPLRRPQSPHRHSVNSLIGSTLSPQLHVVSFCCKFPAPPAIDTPIQSA